MPDIWMFLVSAAIVTIAPGPDNLYVLTRGISQGKKAAIAAALGFATGCLWHTLLAAIGVAALIKQSEMAFNLIKFAGAGYLCYIGFRALTGKSQISLNKDGAQLAMWPIFKQSIIANMLNPKVTLFFIAFLPQFVNVSQGNVPVQLSILGLLFMLQTAVIFGLVGLCAGRLGSYLQKSPKIAGQLDKFAGCTFIGLGIRVALQTQK
ncbi:LysE family translocator [Leeia sp. TBRC 13508]|uniref:LysE family translocator n=1 Tax=Leeia speluncae TaxID=2884804 RepID=A0ABS8D5G6_9NEIS|nr:LysE family translocator [Leeia speluncae]MCB6183449.1 LysE family translocator [Leeia speluncae]